MAQFEIGMRFVVGSDSWIQLLTSQVGECDSRDLREFANMALAVCDIADDFLTDMKAANSGDDLNGGGDKLVSSGKAGKVSK